ncbi:ribosome biogenesis GTPase Der [Acidaminococcus fermentans]|uniref:GTPase Der n=6 Tax=Acidaminococcus fermentans TaxID=905 RepID=D2RKJ6_ACIFV|nr:ribosome biogenesis GTPase Der [Acidaminococcus fermentans]ADB47598.1 ribosome-associated GTPase EngA [Acidaminococcus fermentans DSM 20731]MCI6285813.1 ribosome biogenesis GTPase Der [Acidaminococcus fermentans]MDD6286799.1 ribosome biogenesis GTPase Der [Acidaminococcus fermentans]MDD7194995.1 ribosome biogenesis GTPase Der [Acidaminococcus fermentans]MDY2852152.1 ribosome biogenesis GTPase Der [Acidaminococcus fermentans]
MSKPIVAIVGRPNVGKSTLFNIFADSRISIVEDTPGVTRDRLYADAEWLDRKFTMVDTGGIEMQNTDSIAVSIRQQAEVAVREADVILFVCDARTGITNDDMEVAKMLRQSRKPVVLAVNKADTPKQEAEAYEFYNLGIGEPYLISASNRLNLGDLLDAVVEKFPEEGDEDDDSEDVIKVAIIGRPNVGKSSIFNDIIGQTRSIVSDVAGTTRDAIDVPVEKDGQTYLFIDTAGMRRKGKIDEPIEKYSIIRTLRAVDRSDVVLLVLNAVEGITEQDKKIAGYAHEAGKGIVIVVNKWDLYPNKTVMSTEEFTKQIRHELIFMPYANVVYVSALTQQRISRLPEMIKDAAEANAMRISTSVLNQVVTDAVAMNQPPMEKGKRLKILYTTQVKVKPPTFVIFCNEPEIMHFSYQRYLENQLREAFGFKGTPINIIVRGKNEDEA